MTILNCTPSSFWRLAVQATKGERRQPTTKAPPQTTNHHNYHTQCVIPSICCHCTPFHQVSQAERQENRMLVKDMLSLLEANESAADFLSKKVLPLLPPKDSNDCSQLLCNVLKLKHEDSLLISVLDLTEFSQQKDSLSSTSDLVRLLQLQAMLRLALWESHQDAFSNLYTKWVKREAKKHSKKKPKLPKNQQELIFQHITRILSLAVLQLSPQTQQTTAAFLKQSLVLSASKRSRHYFLDFFEVADPLEIPKAKTSRTALLMLSPLPSQRKPPAKRKRTQATDKNSSSQSSIDPQTSTLRQRKPMPRNNIFETRVKLTVPAQRRNSLLGKSAQKFVGSHFNTNLSNINTLFRQVKSAKQRPGTAGKQLIASKRNNIIAENDANASRSVTARRISVGTVAATPRPDPKENLLACQSPNLRGQSHTRVAPLVIGESPQKKRPAQRRSIFGSVSSSGKGTALAKPKTASSSASMIAQAMKATQSRRKKQVPPSARRVS